MVTLASLSFSVYPCLVLTYLFTLTPSLYATHRGMGARGVPSRVILNDASAREGV